MTIAKISIGGRDYLLTPSQFAFDLLTSIPLSLVEKIVSEVSW